MEYVNFIYLLGVSEFECAVSQSSVRLLMQMVTSNTGCPNKQAGIFVVSAFSFEYAFYDDVPHHHFE